MKSFRERKYSQYVTIKIHPRRRADGGWCWRPEVTAQRGSFSCAISPSDGDTTEWSYEEARALAEKWAFAAEIMALGAEEAIA